MRTTTRRMVIRTMLAFLSLSPIVFLELALRVCGYGETSLDSPLSATDRDPLVDLHSLRPLFVKNEETQQWEIPRERWNYFCPTSFPFEKQRDVFRVFALGGSTTQGQPYRTETAFPKWLQLHLQAAAPEKAIEMINVGGISYASYRVSAILDEVLQYEPDLIVLYTGHNEFLEARTYDKQLLVPSAVAPAFHRLGQLKIVTLVNYWMHRTAERSPQPRTAMPAEVDTILDQPSGMERYQRDADWKQAVETHFRLTLNKMLDRCQARSVPVVLCVPASDWLNTPPFKSEASASLSRAQQVKIQQWAERLLSTDCTIDQRRELATQILQMDEGYAMAQFVLGRIAYDSEHSKIDEARKHLSRAIADDVCPLRATPVIEQAIREQQHREGLILIDTPRLFDQWSSSGLKKPDGIPDPAWFVDHVHPTIAGHQAIGEAIYQQLVAHRRFHPESGSEHGYDELVNKHLSTLGEEYFGRAAQRLEGVKRWARQSRAFEPVSAGAESENGTR